MKKPSVASPADQLIESLLELQKLAQDAQDERLRAIELRKAYECLREHRPQSKSTKTCLDEVLAMEYKARTLMERLVDRMKTLLLSANERVLAAELAADQANAALAALGVSPVNAAGGAGSAGTVDSVSNS